MTTWLSFGVSGFRVDAANHLIEGSEVQSSRLGDPHGLLQDLRRTSEQHKSNALLLGEVDEPPAPCGWANFLRNLDELDLERLTDDEREEVLDTFAPDEDMRIFDGRGARRRLAPMLEGNHQHVKCALSVLLSLPGTPMVVYGDEIGLGENLSRQGRNAVRVPMHWSKEKNGGFSSAAEEDLIQPVIDSGSFGYEEINVADQQEDPESLLNWFKRLVYARRECPEFGYGAWRLVETDAPEVLAHRCMWKGSIVMAVHHLSGEEQEVMLGLKDQRGRRLQHVVGGEKEWSIDENTYRVQLKPYGFEWYRVKGERSDMES